MKVEINQDGLVLHLPILPPSNIAELIAAIEHVYANFEQNTDEKKRLQKYSINIQPITDKTQILKAYKQPDMSKIVGILPDDEPFEDLIKMK
ncbi:MAG: hypothetical protein HC913_23465 [Microscillaceae bacterium]|nr:hypothetical protein [Microscillaceae bacterium]